MTRIVLPILASGLVLALAACQQADQPPAQDTATLAPAATPPTAAPAPAATSPAHLALAPLGPNDGTVITEAMDNVGGCQFVDGEERTLLSLGLPDSNTAKGIAVARPGGRQVRLTTEEGGRLTIEAGPTMRFEGTVLKVSHPSGPGKATGIETYSWPATLAVSDADGAARTYTGSWQCGV